MNEIEIHVGDEFSTPFETGCIAKSEPEPWGAFDALDSEGVLCSYMVSMVTAVTRRAGGEQR